MTRYEDEDGVYIKLAGDSRLYIGRSTSWRWQEQRSYRATRRTVMCRLVREA